MGLPDGGTGSLAGREACAAVLREAGVKIPTSNPAVHVGHQPRAALPALPSAACNSKARRAAASDGACRARARAAARLLQRTRSTARGAARAPAAGPEITVSGLRGVGSLGEERENITVAVRVLSTSVRRVRPRRLLERGRPSRGATPFGR